MMASRLKTKHTGPKVIAIDGPAGAGKSTVAKALAKKINFSYLDTGAMYRAVTLKALREGLNLKDAEALVALAKATTIELIDEDGILKVLLDGNNVTDEIRTMGVTNNTFYIARIPKVRDILVRWQREMGQKKNVVAEGRDVTTVVFPNAFRKFYLDANPQERFYRRSEELKQKNQDVNDDRLKEELQNRDQMDLTRKVGPLKKADDAIVIDSTDLSVDQVVKIMMEHIHEQNTH